MCRALSDDLQVPFRWVSVHDALRQAEIQCVRRVLYVGTMRLSDIADVCGAPCKLMMKDA